MDFSVFISFGLTVAIGGLCSYVGYSSGKEDGYQDGYRDGIHLRITQINNK